MKRAAILHGTDGDPSHNWQPWLKQQFEKAGYEVFAPVLPDNHRPNQRTYEQFFKDSGWDFADNIIVGHSSGATATLNLLLSDWLPKVKAVALVGAFLNERLTKDLGAFPPGNFDDLFIEQFDSDLLKQRAGAFYFVHGDDDPYCSFDDAKELCDRVDGTFIAIPNGHHLGGSSGRTDLPELFNRLAQDNMLQ